MQFSQSTKAPKWFQSDDSKIYASVTSGSSPFNEWYEFDDREDALDLINKAFDSQTFLDRFAAFNGEYYLEEEIIWDGDSIQNLVNLEPASIGEMVEAESRF